MATKSTKTNGILLGVLFFLIMNIVLFFGWNCVSYYTRATLFPSHMILESIGNMSYLIDDERNNSYYNLGGDAQKDLWNNMHFYIEWNDSSGNVTDTSAKNFDDFLLAYSKNESNLVYFSWQEFDNGTGYYGGVSYLTSKNEINNYIVKNALESFGVYELDNNIHKIAFIVKNNLAPSTSLYSMYSNFLENLKQVEFAFNALLASAIAMIFLLSVKFRRLGVFNYNLAQFTGWFWIEIKAFVFLIIILQSFPQRFTLIILFWTMYGFLNELHFFGFKMFAKNSICSLMKIIHNYTIEHGFQKQWALEFIGLVAIEVGCLFPVLFVLFGGQSFDEFVLVLFLLIVAFYLLYRYYVKYLTLMRDMNKMIEKIESIREGEYQNITSLSKESLLHQANYNLDRIQEGINTKITEQLKSEKMKIELITNVSHDLKTPITSLINYSDLLLKEQLNPAYANDYVKIISQKSMRLKNLVQDLFEISKASSGNLIMNMESIEINDLLKQTLAELDEKIQESNLIFKISYLDETGHIFADGKRLYNVIENLISNALKYSMPHTRVYVDLLRGDGTILISIKNISNYELNFDPENLLERFVRGDVSRSTEGSGLGLAISRSFVELMNARISLHSDGDLFKVEIQFDEIEHLVIKPNAQKDSEEISEN